MSAILGMIWFVLGIIFAVAGRDFLEVTVCFFLFGIFMGVNELSLIRQELEDIEEDE